MLGDIKFEARLRNRSQSVNVSAGAERYEFWRDPGCGILLVGDLNAEYQRRCHLRIWYSDAPQYPVHLHFPEGSNGLDNVVQKFRNHLHQTTVTVSHLKGLKLHYSRTGVSHSDYLPICIYLCLRAQRCLHHSRCVLEIYTQLQEEFLYYQ
jgi:hypothetical protein